MVFPVFVVLVVVAAAAAAAAVAVAVAVAAVVVVAVVAVVEVFLKHSFLAIFLHHFQVLPAGLFSNLFTTNARSSG